MSTVRTASALSSETDNSQQLGLSCITLYCITLLKNKKNRTTACLLTQDPNKKSLSDIVWLDERDFPENVRPVGPCHNK